MQTIKINGKDYDLATLSDNAKAQLQCLQFVDAELARLGMQTAVLKTARQAYANALNRDLEANAGSPVQQLKGDTIQLG